MHNCISLRDMGEEQSKCKKIDLSSSATKDSGKVYFVRNPEKTSYNEWVRMTPEELFEQGAAEFVAAEGAKDAEQQIMALMPATTLPGSVWASNSYSDTIVVAPIETIVEAGSVEELVTLVQSVGRVIVTWKPNIGGQRKSIFDLDLENLGCDINTDYFDGVGSYHILTWAPEAAKLKRIKKAPYEALDKLYADIKRALPVNLTALKRGYQDWEKVLSIDVLITLYNALYGAKSHRRLKVFQAFLKTWPGFKAGSDELRDPRSKCAAVVVWLDAECRACKKRPIPEDELVEVPEKRTKIPAYCNPGYLPPKKSTKRAAKKAAAADTEADEAVPCKDAF